MNDNRIYINHPLLKENKVIRRAYQENVFISCINSNCLVIIPTGLGKTIIALILAIYKLSKFEDLKVIFLAPTKPLVNQHRKLFIESTRIPEEQLVMFTGAISPAHRKEEWDNTRVLFATPQVLQNDIISNNYSLSNVSLIIFDECHRAVGNYAYTFIAQKYMSLDGSRQILGITASPGATEEKINIIKENLFIDKIEIRTEKDEDVKPYIQKVDIIWIKIDLPEDFLEILKILEKKLKEIYKFLKHQNFIDSEVIRNISRLKILGLNKEIDLKISQTTDDNEKFAMFNAKKMVANALRLSHMIELLETQGLKALEQYFTKNEENIQNNKSSKSLNELFQNRDFKKAINLTRKLISEGLIHPKMKKLKESLSEQISLNENSRILVFSQYRDSVNNIINYFGKDDVIQIHKFIGQQTKGRDKGMSQKNQLEILDKFKEGIYNVLVSTNVGEEGLDIPDCDLVIFYDMTPSVVRSIQRRGRTGRQKAGKIIILIAKGTRDEGYYWAELAKEKKMKESLIRMKNSKYEKKKNLMDFIKDIEQKDNAGSENTLDSESVTPIRGAEDYTIYVDNRETASSVVRTLSLYGVQIKLQNLEVADYIISKKVGVERKSTKDFSDSIKDGRFFKELKDLSQNFYRPILILEGENPIISSNLSENAIYGAIFSVMINMGIYIYQTKDSRETAKTLYHLAKKEQSEKKQEFKLRFEKAPKKISRLLEFIIAGVPGINYLRAKSLLSKFHKIKDIFNADIGDLMETPKIGKKLGQKLYKIANFKYQNDKFESK